MVVKEKGKDEYAAGFVGPLEGDTEQSGVEGNEIVEYGVEIPNTQTLLGNDVIPATQNVGGVEIPATRDLYGVEIPDTEDLSGIEIPATENLGGVEIPATRDLYGAWDKFGPYTPYLVVGALALLGYWYYRR